jgi:ABC-type amino acid transport system permease subunit
MGSLILSFIELALLAGALAVIIALRSRRMARWRPSYGQPIFRHVPVWVLVVLWFVLMLIAGAINQANKLNSGTNNSRLSR